MDWKSIIGTVAPGIATALGGPLAGIAVRTLSQVLLGTADGSPEAVEKAVLAADPSALLQLKQAELQFQKDMKALDIDLERIHASDRDSARRREAEVKDWTPRVLAFVIVSGFLATVFCVLAGVVEGLKDPLTATLVGTLIGYVSAKADQVCSYFFGSTAGSQAKTDAMVKAAVR
jgi:hypothetical protein